jgi:hypothetical protein
VTVMVKAMEKVTVMAMAMAMANVDVKPIRL